MIVISLDSLATCLIIGIVLLFMVLISYILIPNSIPRMFVLFISVLLIFIPIIILSEASYVYPRINYGYFANINNALRHTHSINKPLVIEHFTGIYNKKKPTTILEPSNNNQLDYNTPSAIIFKPLLPSKQDLDEHRFAQNYEPNIFDKKRKQLNDVFNKHYIFDPKILAQADKYNHLFEKGAIGAHIRFAGHYINKSVDFNSQIKSYTDYIDNSDYPYVFLATHLKDVEDIFKEKYGNRLIIHDHYRNPDTNSDWTSNNLDQKEEDTNVIIDMVMLSKCKEIIGGPSNVFYAALWYNPELKFFIPDILKTAISG